MRALPPAPVVGTQGSAGGERDGKKRRKRMRAGGRKAGDLRVIRVTPGVQKHAEGSVLF